MRFSQLNIFCTDCFFDEKVSKVLRASGAEIDSLKKDLEEFLDSNVETVDLEEPVDYQSELEIQPIQTPSVQRVLQYAILHMHSAGKQVIDACDVLVAVFSEEESHAVFFLKSQGVSRLDVIHYISHGISKLDDDEEIDEDRSEEIDLADEDDTKPRRSKPLERYTDDLCKMARAGELSAVFGRDQEIMRAIKILARKEKNNPLFLGDPGVGKTAIAHGIANSIENDEVPDQLRGAKLYSLDIGSLVAGTKFRGEFEERIKSVVKALSKIEKSILFIDEVHTIVGAGSTGSGSMDAANLLKPALQSGKIRVIGSTTYEDYKKSFEKDRALSRRFSTIELKEPSVEETLTILKGHRKKFEDHHGCKYSAAALKAAAELSAKYINDRFLPDKAIDVIDEAGAANSLLTAGKRKKTISAREIEKIVSSIAKVPIKSLTSSDEKLLQNLDSELKSVVYGQDEAIKAVVRAIKRKRANIEQEDRPIGSFLFAGPTGVGKTEVAKQLAQQLGVQFHRFDMSEYMEKHTVAKFIGAPPGYVGYDEGGQLTDLVRKQPYAVLLLDEIEKAHADIFNVLLQVMDTATLTDAHGKKADFRNIILIMTTNAGSQAAATVGFGKSRSSDNRDREIKKLFKPEFRNRLDEIVYFSPLEREVMLQIVDKFVGELAAQLKGRKISFSMSDEARTYLADNGFDELLGARPMARLIQKEIKDPLTDEILFGKLKGGGKVSIEMKDGFLDFAY